MYGSSKWVNDFVLYSSISYIVILIIALVISFFIIRSAVRANRKIELLEQLLDCSINQLVNKNSALANQEEMLTLLKDISRKLDK